MELIEIINFKETIVLARKKKTRKKRTDKIIVESLAYGRHLRAPRGSRSRAELNTAMKAHGQRMLKSNGPAKLIMDALQPFREDFTGGLLWQRLVSHFAAQANEGKAYSAEGIRDWDLNTRYPTSGIMYPNLKILHQDDFSMLEVNLNYTFSDRFMTRSKDITAFRITIIFLFPDFKANKVITIPIVLPDKLLGDEAPVAFMVQPPRLTNSYIVCFKAQACANGKILLSSRNVNKAMCLISSGTKD